jgi:hypothetical protein
MQRIKRCEGHREGFLHEPRSRRTDSRFAVSPGDARRQKHCDLRLRRLVGRLELP